MKKLILGVSIVVLTVFCVSSETWAMGKRGGSSGSSNSHQSTSSASNQSNVGSNGSSSQNDQSFGGVHNNEHSTENNGSNSGHSGFIPEMNNFNTANDEGFPAATPVPEPATMSLMGMGLASFLLASRKKRL